MTEAIVAGAVAGAIAGAIVALAVTITSRRRDGGWRSYTARRGTWQSGGGAAQVVRMTHTYTPDQGAAPVSGFPMSDARGRVPSGFSFDALEDSGKRVLAIAQDEAILMNHNYIGTEHLLLGLVRGDADGPAGRTLARLGITLDKARTALRFIVGQGEAPTSPSEITMSPRTRKVLELAMDEARTLGHAQAGAAEICLGLIREGQGIASGIIESLGVPLDAARSAVLAELAGQAAAPPPRPPDPRSAQTGTFHGPFDRFNDRAKRVLALAQDEAIRFNHNYIGPEHILLGLVREGEGVAGRALGALGVALGPTRRAVEQFIGRGESTTSPSEITLIPRAKRVIELAIDEWRKLGGQGAIGTEHLLLGILRDDTSIACRILVEQGAPGEKVRAYVLAALETKDQGGSG